MVVIVHTEPQADGNQCRVTTVLHALYKSLAAMSGNLVAADLTVIHDDKSGAGKGAFRGHHSRLQSRSGRDDLEGGSRFVGVVDTAVSPHGIQLFLFLFRRQCGRVHRHNAAVLLHFRQLR